MLCEEQNGFQKDRSTLEHIFTITTIAETRQMLGKDVFAAFIDFKKAYDSIIHHFLWEKLQSIGVNGNLLHLLQALYKGISSNVRVNGFLTDTFEVTCGLRQGCVLSPTLFNIFINDLSNYLRATKVGIYFGDVFVNHLLYADDLVILAQEQTDLQKLLDTLTVWCQRWRMCVNSDKSAVVHFRPKTHNVIKQSFHVCSTNLQIKSEYKYLGVVLDEYLTFQRAAQMRMDQALKALWIIQAKCGDLSAKVFEKLFITLVAPVLDYGSAVWSHHIPVHTLEKIQRRACRNFLGVNRHHPLAAIDGDVCWLPTECRQQFQCILLWCRLLRCDKKRICKLVYENAYHMVLLKPIKNWVYEVGNLLQHYELHQWWLTQDTNGLTLSEIKKMVASIMFRMVRRKWKEEVSKKAKLRTYITFKSSYEPEGYIDTVNCRAHRALLAKLRGGTAPLEIERGRYVGLVPEDRLCKLCSVEVEDEPHFCIRCNALEEERQHLFQFMERITPGFISLNTTDKFIRIMTCANTHTKVSKLQYNMYLQRNSILNK